MKKISTLERFLVAFILFYSALVFCLPVPHSEEVASLYPWWAKRISFGNVLLHELIFVVWIIIYGRRFVLQSLLKDGTPTRQAALWLIALALWCGFISLTAPLVLQDIGRTFRLLLMAVMMFAAVRWTRQTNDFLLELLIIGFFVGTVINLLMSYKYPLTVAGVMRLSGQNTPGVAMGVAIHLAAWLFYHTNKLRAQLFAFSATFVFAFACALSFSRIGWFAGCLGLLAWVYVIYMAQPVRPERRRRLKKARRFFIPLMLASLIVALPTKYVQDGALLLENLIVQKTAYEGEGDKQRLAYLYGTLEIVSKYPWGVGYSGFYDAMTVTETYHTPEAAVEESPSDANPHATFLWYATAGGIPGLVMAIMVFIMLLNSMRVGLTVAMGRDGLVLFMFAASTCLLMGLTVPYLLNSIILIVPAAIAAGWGWRSHNEYT